MLGVFPGFRSANVSTGGSSPEAMALAVPFPSVWLAHVATIVPALFETVTVQG